MIRPFARFPIRAITHTLTLLIAALMLPQHALTAAEADTDTAPKGISSKTLENGMEIIVIENHAVPLATVSVTVRNGAFTEPPEFDGLSHLYEHMFFKGNAVIHNETEYQERERELGARANATTSTEVVRYFMTVHKKNMYGAAETLRDALLTPLFSRDAFLRELPVVLGEFDRNEATPSFHLWREMGRKLWYEHFSRKNALGDREVIINATREQMKTIQNRYYVPNNSALIVGGDVVPAEVFQMAEHLFGDWKPTEVDPFEAHPLPEHPPLKETERIAIVQDVQTSTIDIGWHGPSVGEDTDATYAADVLSFVLGQPDSKFQRNLVDTGLVDSVELGYSTQAHTGPIYLMASTSPDRVDAAWKAIQAELGKLTGPEYITDAQIEAAKNILEIQEIYEREQTSDFVHTLGFWWSVAGLDYYLTYIDRLREVSREDIYAYVDTYITDQPRVEALLVSADDLDSIEFVKNAEIIRPETGTSGTVLDQADAIATPDTETFDVDGLEVVLRRNPESQVVVASLLVKGGLPYYGKDEAGREALLLSLLEKGSESYSKEEIARQLARTGATLSGEARHDYSTYSLRTLDRDFAENFAIMADVFTRPLLDETEFKLARERHLSALAMRDDSPDAYISVLASRNFYRNHPYEVPPDGLREPVEAITPNDIRETHAEMQNRNRLKLFVMGNLTRDQVEAAVGQGFDSMKTEPFEWDRETHTLELPPELLVDSRQLPTNYIFGCFQAPNYGDPDYPALQVATSILSDRLYEEIRQKRNLTYAVASILSSRWANYGVLYVTAARPNVTVSAMLEQVREIVEQPVSEKELTDKVEEMITRDLMGNEATSSQVGQMVLYEATGGGWENAAEAVERMRSVTAIDVQAAAEKYFKDFYFAAIGDPDSFDEELFTSH